MSNDATDTQAKTMHTGQQYTIYYGKYVAVITELGATLRVLRYMDKDVIVPFDADEPIPCSNGTILAPFPNRVEDGEFEFKGKHYQLPIDEHSRNNAIHGYGYRYYWHLEQVTETSVTLSWRTPPVKYYPFDLKVITTYRIGPQGLTMTIYVLNQGKEAAPWACGIHPWLANGRDSQGDAIESDNEACSLLLPCKTHILTNDRLIPIGEEQVSGKYDLQSGPKLKAKSFDDAWCNPSRDSQGKSTAIFTRPDGLQISIYGDETIQAWQVCTGTGFDPSIRPAGVAVEPMTAYANAFRTGQNLIVLEPGQSYKSQMGYHVTNLDEK